MNPLLIPLISLIAFSSQPSRYGSSFSEIDPQQVSLNYTHVEHMAGSILLTHAAKWGLEKLGMGESKARFWAPTVAFSLGCLKEAYDATRWESGAGEGWDSTDLAADFTGVSIGHLTYGNQFVDSFCLPASIGPTLYERTGSRGTAILSSSLSSIVIRPPLGESRGDRALGLAGGTLTTFLATYLDPQWQYDREYWSNELGR